MNFLKPDIIQLINGIQVSFLELGNQGALSQVVAETDVECASLFYQTIDLLVNFDKQV